MNKYVPGHGSLGAKLMIVGDCPTYQDEDMLRPFTDNKELNNILKDASISRSDLWMTNACKYMVPPNMGKNKKPFHVRARDAGIDLDVHMKELREEINAIKPNCILSLGSSALWMLTGKYKIDEWRGSILQSCGTKLVGTYNPAHLNYNKGGEIQGYWQRQVMVFDFRRALEQSKFPELNRPSRLLTVCKDPAELQHFIDQYKDYPDVSVDIEAHNTCVPVCIGLAFNKQHGMTVPLWNDIGQKEKISNIPDAALVQIWIILARLLHEKNIIGQNFGYDRDKIRRLGFAIRRLISDTMLKSFTISPELPKNLAFNTSTYTEEPYYKDEGMYEGSINDLLIGCARDSCVTKEIDEAMDAPLQELGLTDFYNNFVMQLSPLYAEIETTGFKVDRDQQEVLLKKYIKQHEYVKHELWKRTGEYINPNSPKQVGILLYDVMKLPKYEGTGEELLTKLLNSKKVKADAKEIIKLILEDRGIKKTIGTYILSRADFDGRMKTSYFLCLKTGRTSTTLLEPPIRPWVEFKDWDTGAKKKKAIGSAFQTQTKHGDIGADIRSQYCVDKDEVFIQADSSQAEARVIFLLAKDEQALIDVDIRDYHAYTASWFLGGTEETYSKKILGYECPERFLGKTLRHAGHLGSGFKRAAVEVNNSIRKYKIQREPINEGFAQYALNIFHTKQPSIQKVFQAEVIEQLKRFRLLTAPLPYGIDAPCGGKRTFFDRWSDELFRDAFSYIPQRAVSDNTKCAGLRLWLASQKKEIPPFKIIMESHDSLLFSINRQHVDELAPIIKTEFERPINFEMCSLPRRSLVIPCELEISETNYKDMRKYSTLKK
jgi:uracil-DNA glycosylase family 4